LDVHIHELLSLIPEDAIVVIMSDHGEEFDHGAYRHARLYDECVRVPFLSRNLGGERMGTVPVRQIDLAPTILQTLEFEIPDVWSGKPVAGEARDTFLLNHSPHLGQSYAGIRTSEMKLIKTFEGQRREATQTECYDLRNDPHEENNLHQAGQYEDDRGYDLNRRLNDFLSQDDIWSGLQYGTSADTDQTDGTERVEERLSALGYK